MARYLITGIAGFIGSSLAHTLVDQGHEVSGIDNLSTGNLENLADIRNAISFQQMDLQDVAGVRSACEGIDYVLHQGALASVPRSVKDPLTSHESNINGTLNLLIAARDAKVRRIVYAASSSAYGDQPTQPKQEDMLPRPLSPYAVQKLTCEYYIQSFLPGLRSRRRLPPLLQYLWPAPGGRLTLLRRHRPVHLQDDGRRNPHHLRRRPHQPRLQLHRQRRQRQPACLPRSQRSSDRPRIQHRHR